MIDKYRLRRLIQIARLFFREAIETVQNIMSFRSDRAPYYLAKPQGQKTNRIGTDAWRTLKKIHAGCGETYLESYINIDAPEEFESLSDYTHSLKPDLRTSITELSMFQDGSIDVIEGYHVIEHVPYWEADQALKEFYRILKSGGELVLECPDLWKCSLNYLVNPAFSKLGLEGFYGDKKRQIHSMVHQYGYSTCTLAEALLRAGFDRNHILELPGRRYRQRDLRVIAFKGSVPASERIQRASDRLRNDTLNLYAKRTVGTPSESVRI